MAARAALIRLGYSDAVATWGVIPAAGHGSRIQPLAFSKELLPVGSFVDQDRERPRAVSEYLIERMVLGGATRLCFVISPGKSDILEYYGGRVSGVDVFYAVQPEAAGLCDAIFRAAPLVHPDEWVLVGLPDTIWYPAGGLSLLPDDPVSLLCFPVDEPRLFDAVVCAADGSVEEVQVKTPDARSSWIWGAFKLSGRAFHELHELWAEPGRRDEQVGTLINAYLARGRKVSAVKAGTAYVDVGTVKGYRKAIDLLGSAPESGPGVPPRA